MFDPAVGESTVTLGSDRSTRDRVPYPANGVHAITLTAEERRFVRGALAEATPSHFVRAAVLKAAGLAAPTLTRAGDGMLPPKRVTFRLSREERALVDARLRGRDLGAWLRDVVRVAAGMRNNPWSICADAIVRKGFRRWGLDELLEALPGRNSMTIYVRARHLGLSTELTDERAFVSGAAKVAGYDPRTVVRMLRGAGISPAVLTGITRDAKQRRRFVRKADVVRVVEKRAAEETLTEACERLGHGEEAMKRQLLRLGHVRPEGERIWRLPPAAFDEAGSAIRGEGETFAAAVTRTGVGHCSLRKWLTEAGLISAARATQYNALDPAAVDRVVKANRSKLRVCGRCGEPGHYRATCSKGAAS